MNNLIGMIFWYLVAAWFLDWWPFGTTSSQLFSTQSNYNVYFYWPDSREEYIGIAKGLESCNAAAVKFANLKKLPAANWGYICCKITSQSSCAVKER